jgi:hypothetical protein
MKSKKTICMDELKVIRDPHPAKMWVNSLFEHMFKNHLKSFTLSKTEGIPSIPFEDELPEGELDFTKIINRLKIMSGIDPTTYKEPHEGNIQMGIHGIWYTVKTTFIDSDGDSKCEITISKKP